MSKAGKIYLWICLALLLVCLLLYRPIEWYCFVVLGAHASFYLGLLFATLIVIHLNIFWGLKGFVERFFATLIAFSFGFGIIEALFEAIRWIIEHVRII